MKFMLSLALVVVLAQTGFGKPSLSLHAQFQNFKATHNKQYKDAFEESYRKGIFAATLANINKHNDEYAAGEHTWTMGVNQLSDLTHEEFMEMNKLRVPDVPQPEKKYQMQAQTMAAEIDWRAQGYVTDIKDQGQCGSCWAFGAIASLEAAHFEKNGELVQMSESQVVDCDKEDGGCNGGWYDTAWKYINEEGGVETTADYPYHPRNGICKAGQNDFVAGLSGCWGGPNTYCDNHGKIGDEEVLKTMLNDRPISVAVDATDFQSYNSGIMTCGRLHHQLNHAVFAVGYGSDYWIVKNSWGKAWGEEGYVKIQMGHNPCGIADYPAYAIAN